jgi:hypothetical protein
MATYDKELLDAAGRLLGRRKGQRGKLPSARIRRSISTSYYAQFHFLIEEAAARLIGTHNDLRRRRRILARAFQHKGINVALGKVGGATIESAIANFFRAPGGNVGALPSPAFARDVAKAFSDAQTKRHDADYDMNKALSETDARLLRARVGRAIDGWRKANTAADKDFKHAVCLFMLLRGKLREDN